MLFIIRNLQSTSFFFAVVQIKLMGTRTLRAHGVNFNFISIQSQMHEFVWKFDFRLCRMHAK